MVGQFYPLRLIVSGIERFPSTARVLILLAVIGLNIAGFLRFRDRIDPAATLRRAGEAIRQGDSSAFEQEADIESIASSFYYQHLIALHLSDGTASVAGVKERDTTAIARRLRRWIETGRIDDSERPRLTLLGEFIRSAIRDGSGKVWTIRTAHNLAIATVDLRDPDGIHAVLEIKLFRQQGFWRISEVTNVNAVVRRLLAQEEERVARANVEIDSVTPIEVTTGSWSSAGPVAWRLQVASSTSCGVEYSVDCGGKEALGPSVIRTLNFDKPGISEVHVLCPRGAPDGEPPDDRPPTMTVDEIRRPSHPLRRVKPRALD